MLDERQITKLVEELTSIAHLRNAAQCDNEKAERNFIEGEANGADIDELKHLDSRIDSTWESYELYEDRLLTNAQLLRRVFGIDIQWIENAYGYITKIKICPTPHIKDTIEVEIHLQGYINRWIESEKKRIEEKYFTIVK